MLVPRTFQPLFDYESSKLANSFKNFGSTVAGQRHLLGDAHAIKSQMWDSGNAISNQGGILDKLKVFVTRAEFLFKHWSPKSRPR